MKGSVQVTLDERLASLFFTLQVCSTHYYPDVQRNIGLKYLKGLT